MSSSSSAATLTVKQSELLDTIVRTLKIRFQNEVLIDTSFSGEFCPIWKKLPSSEE